MMDTLHRCVTSLMVKIQSRCRLARKWSALPRRSKSPTKACRLQSYPQVTSACMVWLALCYEHLAASGWDGENPRVEVVPAVSAAQASASVLGAPLMQDFCAISLSDLMTPWETIRKRLEAAAYGDFVISIYNPRSRRRRKQIVEAREIVLKHRACETPVGIVRNASRPDEVFLLTTLGELDDHFECIDMFTTLIIGNSTTYIRSGRMITPRGYMNSRDQAG